MRFPRITFAQARLLQEQIDSLKDLLERSKKEVQSLTTELACTKERWVKTKKDFSAERDAHTQCVQEFNAQGRRFDQLVGAVRSAGLEGLVAELYERAGDSAAGAEGEVF